MITKEEYKLTTIDMNNCCYSIRLNDERVYNVHSRKENGKRNYFIKKDGKEIMLDDEVKKLFLSEVRVYEISGI